MGRLSVPTLERGSPGAGVPPPRSGPPPPPAAPASFSPQIPMPILAGLATFATTLCLGNLFDGLGWWLTPATGAIVVAGLAGELGRRIHTPIVLMPLLYAVAGWLYVIPVAAHGSGGTSGVSLLPGADTVSALRDLAQSGTNDIRSLAVPVPERPGFLLLTVAGVYLIAALVDGIAIGLRTPAAAGIPLLAILVVPAGVVTRGVGLFAFIAAAAAYIALLLGSGRRGMIRWARLPSGSSPQALGIRRATGPTGRRVGALALVLALALPLLIPRYSTLARHHHGSGTGGGSATVIEPTVSLEQQLHSNVTQPLLTVRTATPEYLRLTALEHFDGQRFTLGGLSAGRDARVARGLPPVTTKPTSRVQATIDVMPALHQRYLPVPFQATAVQVTGDWRLASGTDTIFSAQTDTSRAHYTVTSAVPSPTPAQLRAQSATTALPSDVAGSLQLPSDLPIDVAQLSTQLTGNQKTEYDKAAAIQAYLRGPLFTYDLNHAPTGPNALEDFLLHDRRGYCEQFAGAMVVLARYAGVPARVAIGFTPGTLQPNGSYLITNRDAHAWPEIWFPQAGWVRFEPTKRDSSTVPPAYTIPPASSTATPTPSASASQGPTATPSAGPSGPAAAQPSEAAGPGSAGGSAGGGGVVAGWSVAGLLAAAALASPALIRRRRRRDRLARGLPADVWGEIVDTATDLGLEVPPNLTPRRVVARWAARAPAAGEEPEARPGPEMPDETYSALVAAAHAEELARYAPAGGGQQGSGDVALRVRQELAGWERSFGWRRRLAAVLAPRSVLAAGTEWTAKVRTLIRPRRAGSG